MANETMPSKDLHDLEQLYQENFGISETIDASDQLSLAQPSPLEYVDSFTTCGITEDLLLPEGK